MPLPLVSVVVLWVAAVATASDAVEVTNVASEYGVGVDVSTTGLFPSELDAVLATRLLPSVAVVLEDVDLLVLELDAVGIGVVTKLAAFPCFDTVMVDAGLVACP